MIITQTRDSRHFVGSMNPGTDMVESLTQICVDNAIFCAQFSGIGYLKDPRMRSYDVTRKGFEPTVEQEGTFHVVAMHGNVSLQGPETVFRCHVIGTLRKDDEEPVLVSGELVGGEVLSVEFSLSTIDDIRLYRAEDKRTGLDPWLHMELGSGKPPTRGESEELPIIASAPGAAPPDPEPGTDGDDSTETNNGSAADVEVGDWLDHPTLGASRVLNVDSDERVTIELESGRKVQLHVGLLNLSASGKREGGTLYKVAIRRRRS